MSSNEAAALPFSEAAFARATNSHSDSPAPSVAVVDAVSNGRVEGSDFADYHGAGLLASVLDATGDIVRGRGIQPSDTVEITSPSGRPWRIPVKHALANGYLTQDPVTKQYVEADRSAQQEAFNELQQVEQAKLKSEQLTFGTDVDNAIGGIESAMQADGLSLGDALAHFVGAEGNSLPEPVVAWGQANGLDMDAQARLFMDHLKIAVEQQVLRPNNVTTAAFLDFLSQNKGPAMRAAMRAFHARDLQGFHQLCRLFLDTGGRARMAKR